jgi:DNA/RNA-binding domain of Phe-tRNA-synthetase-like protein
VAPAARVAPELAAELPGLRLRVTAVDADGPVTDRAPRELRDRLGELSDRFRGGQAIELRRQELPHAHRVLFRHLGLDPDEHRPPLEAAVLERLLRGGFRSTTLLADALLVALVETGVGVWALDGATVTGDLELRPEPPGGAVVIGDDAGTVAPIFADPPPDRAPTKDSRAIVLYAVGAPGVPDLFVDEALWLASEPLTPGGC